MSLAVAAVALAATVLLAGIGAGFQARAALFRATPDRPDCAVGDGRLAGLLRPYAWPLALGVSLMLGSTVVGLTSPWSLKVLIDNVIGGEPLPLILAPAAGLSPRQLAAAVVAAGLGLVLLNVVLDYLVAVLLGAVEQRMAVDLRARVFRRMQNLSLEFHDRNRTGDLVTRLSEDVSRVRDATLAWIDQVLPDVVTLIGILIIATVIDPLLTAASLSVVPLLLYYARSKRPAIRSAERVARDRQGELASLATDSLRNVRLVQAFGRQPQEAVRFRQQLDRTAAASINSLDVSARYSPIARIVLATGSAAVSWVGVVRVLDGHLSVGTLVVYLSYLAGVYGPIRSLSRIVSTFARGAASRERLVELFLPEWEVVDDPSAVPVHPEPARLSFRQVSFGYTPREPVLCRLDLEIEPEETVCFVGASGVGKSTLLALILRLYEPDHGAIELGGVDIRRLQLSSLRDRIALVPQEPWIIDGTVADNIRFGKPAATAAEFRYAARRSLVDEFGFRLPLGFDTPVGEGGALLSGGQLRRIAIARAMIRDAPLLLLDEPTTGLDAAATDEVLAALTSVATDRTMLIVTHDLKVAARADRIIVLSRGEIAEVGTHTELLRRGGEYGLLWSTQQVMVPGGRSLVDTLTGKGGEHR